MEAAYHNSINFLTAMVSSLAAADNFPEANARKAFASGVANQFMQVSIVRLWAQRGLNPFPDDYRGTGELPSQVSRLCCSARKNAIAQRAD